MRRAKPFFASLKPLDAKIADMRKYYAGQPVAASEPVFGYLADLIGLNVHEREIRARGDEQYRADASDVATFEDDLKAIR